MSTIYFGCTMLSPIALWIQLCQERDCTHSPVLPLGTSVTASPGSDGRGQSSGWGQAVSQVYCGGVVRHKVGFYPCSCKSCFIRCTTPFACMRQSQIAICHCSSPRFPIRPFTWETKTAFKCFTSESPACNVLLKHFHHRNLCNLQSQP